MVILIKFIRYAVRKISRDECVLTNVITGKQRDLRRIIVDATWSMRIVWQFQDDNGYWNTINNTHFIAELLKLPIGPSMVLEANG